MNQILWQQEWWWVYYTLSSSQVYIFKACNLGLHPSECPNWICSDILFSCCEDWQRSSRSLSQGEREYHSRFCWVFFPHSSLSLKKTKRNLLYGLGEYCCSSLATVARAWNLFCFCSLRLILLLCEEGVKTNIVVKLTTQYCCLVQVAAMGLNPHKHLGQDLATLQPHFTLLARYIKMPWILHFPFPFSCPLCTLLEAVISMHD